VRVEERAVLSPRNISELIPASSPGQALKAAESTPVGDVVPTYFPRDKDEWQGMLVSATLRPYCESSELCGLAGACLENLCGPCRADAQCASGEVCVLDHCLLAANVTCRSRRDCSDGAPCVLSGFSPDPRGNGQMKSWCNASRGGVPWKMPDLPIVKTGPAPPPPVDTTELVDSVRRIAENGGRGEAL
jgi:hypothetical protein